MSCRADITPPLLPRRDLGSRSPAARKLQRAVVAGGTNGIIDRLNINVTVS